MTGFINLNQVEDLPSLVGDHKEAWRLVGLCNQTDPDLFFEDGDPLAEKVAKATCGDCPVRTTCLEHALVNREEWGVWGGKTARERELYREEWEQGRGRRGMAEARKRFATPSKTERNKDHYEGRLGRAKAARSHVLANGSDGYEDHLEILDLLIQHPDSSCESVAKRMGRSRFWVEKRFREVCAASNA